MSFNHPTFKVFFVSLLFSLVTVSTSAQELKVGAAVRVITPDPLLPVSGGVGTPKKTSTKKGELFARAMVLERGGTRIAIVCLDNLGWSSALGDRSRALSIELLPDIILVVATHTHTSPDAYGFPD